MQRDSKKTKFIKQQKNSGLLSKLITKYQSKDLHNSFNFIWRFDIKCEFENKFSQYNYWVYIN